MTGGSGSNMDKAGKLPGARKGEDQLTRIEMANLG